MRTLELNTDEERVLAEVLERAVRDLDIEIAHTDSHQFKDMLRQRQALLAGMNDRVGRAVPAA